ncbi:MAG: hypothetical protein E7463_14350 [Ruminococcaceae bacterium]|nr:hypothetical protein [Oscillospiraceae bacterium]
MRTEELAKRELIPLLKMNDGRTVTKELWPERYAELKHILEQHIYGITPPATRARFSKVSVDDQLWYAGKVRKYELAVTMDIGDGSHTFPLHLFIPHKVKNPPVFLHIAFRRALPDRYSPIEEITDNGFAFALFCYEDVVNDHSFGDYSDGVGKLTIHGARRRDEWGKIGMWAYAASRCLDVLEDLGEVDATKVAVVGHSRLGKTALWCGALDDRFWATLSNDSGFGGAAIAKHGNGERVIDFLRAGSWEWYCEQFKEYIGKEDELPYDQHMLLAMVAPRLLYIASAEEDHGADPASEFLSACAASEVWELLGEKGMVAPDRMPVVNDYFGEGNIGHHLRPGRHSFSREDWNYYFKFLKSKM